MLSTDPHAGEAVFGWKNLTLFLITIGSVSLCALMLRPFLEAITGAVILAVVTREPYKWILTKLKNRNLAATASLILVTVSIIAPGTFLLRSLGQHLLAAIDSLKNGNAVRGFQTFLDHYPRIATTLQYSLDNISLNQAVQKSAGFVAGKLAFILGGSISVLTQLIVILFLLFFLYRDGEVGLSTLRSLLPLNTLETDQLLSRLTDTIYATVLGRFIVAAAQGLIAGITFATLGVSGAALLGILTVLFAMVPSFGAFIVWLPVTIYLAATHHWIQAVILVAVGSLIISTLDNFLYPVLVGTRLRMHTVSIFLSILGGIWLFGVSGLVLGPIVLSLTESLLGIWRQRTSRETPDAPQSSI